jgi:hypothetical protein
MVSETDAASPLCGLDPPETAARPWWSELLPKRTRLRSEPRQRPVWTAQIRESHQSIFGPADRPASFYPLTTFYGRLGEELEQARRHGGPLAVVVLQLPAAGPQDPQRRLQREVEIALRLSVRRYDLPARLAPMTLAVGLPHTGDSAVVVALRLQRVLSRLTGGRVVAGIARLPTDGNTALALLRVATWRSLAALPGSQPDPELTRLLGPLASTQIQPSTGYR